MKRLYDEEGSATCGLTNTSSITVLINEDGESLKYQYSFEDDIHEAEIEYIEDTEDRTGYAEEDLLQAAFRTEEGVVYFLGEFMRNDY
jgi:hypothetical protein